MTGPAANAASPAAWPGPAARTALNAAPAWLSVEHRTHYRYESPVAVAHHQACLRPLEDAHQRLDTHGLVLDPAPQPRHGAAPVDEAPDVFGNAVQRFSLFAPHRELTVVARSRLALWPRCRVPPAIPATGGGEAGGVWGPTVATVAARLRYAKGGAFEPATAFAQPSPFVSPDPPLRQALRDWAAPDLPPDAALVPALLRLMARFHASFAYAPQSTGVDTPLAQAFEQRRGVCQDFAHLFIGMLRAHGLAARYLSGYLLTHPTGDGQVHLLGADASHAWVQVWCPDAPDWTPDGWLDLDPTNNLVPATGHVRLAVGRDYGDVTPLRGVIRGGGRHRLSVAVQTWVDPPAPTGSPAATPTAGPLLA